MYNILCYLREALGSSSIRSIKNYIYIYNVNILYCINVLVSRQAYAYYPTFTIHTIQIYFSIGKYSLIC